MRKNALVICCVLILIVTGCDSELGVQEDIVPATPLEQEIEDVAQRHPDALAVDSEQFNLGKGRPATVEAVFRHNTDEPFIFRARGDARYAGVLAWALDYVYHANAADFNLKLEYSVKINDVIYSERSLSGDEHPTFTGTWRQLTVLMYETLNYGDALVSSPTGYEGAVGKYAEEECDIDGCCPEEGADQHQQIETEGLPPGKCDYCVHGPFCREV